MDQINDFSDIQIPKKFSHYESIRNIGSGSSSIVVLAKDIKTNELLACKMIPRKLLTTKDALQHIESEFRIVEQLSHPGICKIQDFIYLRELIILVMEFCPNCTLHDLVASTGRLSFDEANNYFMLILNTLVYLHSKNIAHRDLKLDNIVLSSSFEPKLIDFGLSYKPIHSQPNLCDSYCGTLEFIAPEVLNGGFYDGKKYDIWSLGICYHIMLTGVYPWDSGDDQKITRQIASGKFKLADDLPDESRFLLEKMLLEFVQLYLL